MRFQVNDFGEVTETSTSLTAGRLYPSSLDPKTPSMIIRSGEWYYILDLELPDPEQIYPARYFVNNKNIMRFMENHNDGPVRFDEKRSLSISETQSLIVGFVKDITNTGLTRYWILPIHVP